MKKMNIKRAVLVLLILANCMVIFGFSSQNGEKSGGTSDRIVEFIIQTVYKNKEITQEKRVSIKNTLSIVIRKGAHFSIYMLLGILTYLFVMTYNIDYKRGIIYALLFCFLYACSDEFHQRFVNERSGEIKDVCIDTCGSFFGIISTNLLKKIKKSK